MENQKIDHQEEHFRYRLDIYWKALAVYSIIFIVYAVIRGSLGPDEFSITYDPILLILFLFILFGIGSIGLHLFLRKQLVLTANEIRIENRFRSIRIPVDSIRKIRFRRSYLQRGGPRYRVILLYLNSRKRPIRIRASLYENDRKLVEFFHTLRQRLRQHG